MAHIDHLEGDSLFKINLVSEEEQNVERIKKQAEVEFAKVQVQIDDVKKNIEDVMINKRK